MQNNNVKPPYSSLRPWFIWGLAAFFFFAHYVVRVTPGHISEVLQAAFVQTSKYEFGVLGSAFYLPYVLMQMPVGYLVDRFGSRTLLTIAVFICSASSLIFASAQVIGTAMISRVLLGFCSATAFIGALKLITVWFEPKQLALLVGITQALGMIGGATGAHLAPYLNDVIGWQSMFHLYGIVFFALAILIFCVIRNSPSSIQNNIGSKSDKLPNKATFAQIKAVLFNRYTWINALYAGLIYAPTDVLGELWGKEFLQKIHHLNPYTASHAISFLFIGWAIGGPCAGWLADHWGRKPVMILSAIMGTILLPLVFYVPGIPMGFIMLILFLYGVSNTGLIASYTTAGELHSKELGGFSMAIANMLSVLLGSLLMPVLGLLLDWHASSHLAADGTMLHTVVDYQRSTLILPLCLFLAIFCAFFTKETLVKAKS
ncbi:MFS transporter [Candidatus Berkiella aquae]|uniref:Lysosomal dipeptide transporter MFSD1 n=1 Tax=Candidatus Berkiella aquae TaxID=295108 RepID=A0A0Q9YNY8_9GAMM|nr:MFS transporter [Candidatus Berkiella aquae]MCS5712117.1 MFS transporter [Candidatus Berkiella aquae]